MKTKIANRLVMLQGVVVAEFAASRSDRRAFVAVRPHDGVFEDFSFEMANDLLSDSDSEFGSGDILERRMEDVSSIQEVDKALESLGVDPDTLDVPWKTTYPL